jgi:Fur family transcriptional regulator, ferric uptake regulator
MPIHVSGPCRDQSVGIDVVGSIVKRASYCHFLPEGGATRSYGPRATRRYGPLVPPVRRNLPLLIETQYHLRRMANVTSSASITDTFGRRGLRLTGPRRRVAEMLDRRRGTFTAADLLDDAESRDVSIGRATVFRALDLFTELGLLERIDLPTGEHAYVVCEPVHHHHVVCSVCGRQTDDDAGVQAIVAEMERQTGYRIERHRLELYGTCPNCGGNE